MPGLLFLCTGNSCRSQMAEGFARALARPGTRIWSAGLAPTQVHPLAIRAMAEVGIDISGQRSKSLDGLPLDEIELVVTLCGDADERCPALPGSAARAHWPLPDPAAARGDAAEVFAVFRRVRDEIQERVRTLVGEWPARAPGEERAR